MYEQVDVDLEDLLLDHENPRLGSVDSQTDALRELIKLSPRNFRTMMTSIKDNGLDPGDLFYLVDESADTGIEGYTVIDGNRRLGALKVLREPALLVGTGLTDVVVKRLRDAADGFDAGAIGESRSCVLFDNRADAEDWVLRRHGRGLEGEERIAWGPLEIQRFQGDRSVLDIIDFVERNGGYAPDQWATIKSKIEKRSYVLRRFLDSKAGRDALGLGEETIEDRRLPTSKRDPEYLLRILKKLLDDVASDAIDTRRYNKAADIKEYFEELPDNLKPEQGDPKTEPKRFREINIPRPDTPLNARTPQSSNPKTKPVKLRETLAPKQLEFNQPLNAKGQQFIREATKVRLKEARLSSAFLLRGFIQFAVDTYMNENNIPFWEGEKQLELHVRAERVVDNLVSTKRAKRGDLSGIKRHLAERANKNPSSIQALNDYHHDSYQVPDVEALRSGWDDATALFVAIFGRAGKK